MRMNNVPKGKRLRLLPETDLSKIDAHLGESLDRLLIHADGPMPQHLRPLTQRLRAYVTRGGKRIRPQLCIWAFLCNCDSPINPPLLDVACAWEIFHAFLLVHDDVIDVADTRRQIPSLHRELQSLDHDSPQFGQNMAIVAGDLLFTAAIRLLAEMEIDPAMTVKLIRLFSRIAGTTGFGQAIDLFQAQMPLAGVSQELLLCEYDWKTAAYTFEGPLLSGAILAGADETVADVLSRFSRAIGQAYQLHNDLQDLSVPSHEGCDLVQGKRTVSLMLARAAMTDNDRRVFDLQLDSLATANGQSVRLAESIRLELCQRGVIDQTREMINSLLKRARTIAAEASGPLNASLRLLTDALSMHCFNVSAPAVQSSVQSPVTVNSL
jgi:geranylgeranyl diphosphate synthase type I